MRGDRSESAVRALLERAAEDGRRRRARVRRPMIALGTACVVVGLPLIILDQGWWFVSEVASVVLLLGGWFLACAMVPDDPKSPYFVAAAVLAVEAVLCVWDVFNTLNLFSLARAAGCDERQNEQLLSCRHMMVLQVTNVWDTCVAFCAVVISMHTLVSRWQHGPQPRRARRRIILLMRFYLVSYTIGITLRELSSVVHGTEEERSFVAMIPAFLFAAFVMLLSGVAMSPGGIERVHRRLISRGLTEGASSAAAIASLIGGSGRAPAETMDRALATLRSVPLDRLERRHFAPPPRAKARRDASLPVALSSRMSLVAGLRERHSTEEGGAALGGPQGSRRASSGRQSAIHPVESVEASPTSPDRSRPDTVRSDSPQSSSPKGAASVCQPAEFGRIDAFVSHRCVPALLARDRCAQHAAHARLPCCVHAQLVGRP